MNVETFAEFLKSKYESLDGNDRHKKLFYKFPIQKMFDISVNIYVEINNISTKFKIDASNVYYTDCDGDVEHETLFYNYENYEDKVDYIKFAKYIFELIPKLKFDKFNSNFVENDIEDGTFLCFEKIEHIKMIYEPCCVCKENTTKKTGCGHTLCIECWDKIKYKYCECRGHYDCDNEDDGCGIKPCPICRQSIEKTD